MAHALYQRYRPQQFADLIGQNHIRTTVLSEIVRADTAHAYLLSGPRGVGKTTTARLIARALNCTQRTAEGEPCGTCAECVLILEQKALDVMEIDAASHTGVDHVREHIIEYARTAPSRLTYKVFIIDEVHMLSTSAFNALLKTLEEPPKHVVFILATTELHKVPATIISRCEHFRFMRLSVDDITERLRMMCVAEKRNVHEDVLRMIARRADGALRDAQSILGQVLSIQADQITAEHVADMLGMNEFQAAVRIMRCMSEQNVRAALDEAQQRIAAGAQPIYMTSAMISVLRATILARVTQSEKPLIAEVGDEQEARVLYAAFEQNTVSTIVRYLEIWMKAYEQQKTATITELPIELAIIQSLQGVEETLIQTSVQPLQVKTSERNQPQHVDQKKSQEHSAQVSVEKKPTEPVVAKTIQTPAISESQQSGPSTQPAEEKGVVEPLTKESVEKRWGEVLTAMSGRNQGLFLTLQVGKLVDVVNGAIQLGFQYQFYADRLYEPKNRKMLDDTLREVFHTAARIEAIIGKEFEMKETVDAAGNVEVVAAKELENVWDLAVHAFQPKHIEDVG